MPREQLRADVKELLVTGLRLDRDPSTIADGAPIFGEGLGLDSIDALERVVFVEERFQVGSRTRRSASAPSRRWTRWSSSSPPSVASRRVRSAAVAITGTGALTALGPDVDSLVTGLVEGRSGIGPLTAFPYMGRAGIAAQAVTPGIAGGIERTACDRRRVSGADRFALAVAREACTAAGLDRRLRMDAALAVGATTGGMREAEGAYARRRAGQDRRMRVSRFLGTSLGGAAAAISQGLGFHGPRVTLATACSSSALAIVAAARALRAGRGRVALAIGTDQLCRLTYSGCDALQALDVAACRPFAADRRGLSLGEGAAALVLEDAEHARARGAAIRGYVLGYGVTADAHHLTAPH